jgi:hypothetical protein
LASLSDFSPPGRFLPAVAWEARGSNIDSGDLRVRIGLCCLGGHFLSLGRRGSLPWVGRELSPFLLPAVAWESGGFNVPLLGLGRSVGLWLRERRCNGSGGDDKGDDGELRRD